MFRVIVALVFFVSGSAHAVDWEKEVKGFSFKRAEIEKVVEKISKIMDRNFILDPGVRGKVTIIESHPINVRQAYQAFLTSLALNGYSLVKSGDHWIVRSSRNVQRDNLDIITNDNPPDENRMMTMIIGLKHISAEQVNKNLRMIPSKDGEMAPYPPTNSIIISDFGPNLIRVRNLIRELDKPQTKEMKKLVEKFDKERKERHKFYHRYRMNK